jgi:hypothetical protein
MDYSIAARAAEDHSFEGYGLGDTKEPDKLSGFVREAVKAEQLVGACVHGEP